MRKNDKTTEDKEKNHAVTEDSSNYTIQFLKCNKCPRCGANCVVIQSVDTGFGDYIDSVRQDRYNNP